MMNILRCCRGRLQVTPVTTIFRRPYIKISNKMEILLKQADKIPRNFELIYRYPTFRSAGFLFHTVNFVTMTTFTVVACAYYMDKPINEDERKLDLIQNPVRGVIVGCATFLILALTWTMRSRSPMRIYYHPDSKAYRAIFLGKIPYSLEYYEFNRGQMSYVSPNSILPWRSLLFEANGRKMILYDDHFRTAADFAEMFKPEEK
ncbi:uncharacterized protein LOC100679852 isoform X1 [Nasonia vitripennis]|uniref:Uncharacterized protein n=1 Tax=Nasonia vitripennis TaxID=7425 RepID=A0A7M7HBL2_NASVI|nr:uncharacterized protein LOC100679852 isoform X1 [Nasonia vitripennis]